MPEGYRASLKHPEAEELLDLWLYRPLGWLFVRMVHRTPITPNQVTLLSLAASLAAAWEFSSGALPALAPAAGWYALANVLDCADGQLARVQGSGTPYGRIVDGVADYLGTTAIFLAIGAGFSALGLNLWPEVIAAGLSSALHAAIFDERQGAFLAERRGKARASGPFAGESVASARPGNAGWIGVRLMAAYERSQRRLVDRLLPPAKHSADPTRDAALLRLWSFLGPTTNRTALIASALLGRVDLYLWAVIVPGNAWLVAVWFLQRRIDARPASSAVREEERPR